MYVRNKIDGCLHDGPNLLVTISMGKDGALRKIGFDE